MTSLQTRMKKSNLTVSSSLPSPGEPLELAHQNLAYWSRFTIKQTYEKLKPKRVFTPHVSNHEFGFNDWDPEIALHGPHSVQHGWEWYEIGFFACWNQSGLTTIICFDLPAKMQSNIRSFLCTNTIDVFSPYSAFLPLSDALLQLYDDSVWSIRNYISQWEAVSLSVYI